MRDNRRSRAAPPGPSEGGLMAAQTENVEATAERMLADAYELVTSTMQRAVAHMAVFALRGRGITKSVSGSRRAWR